MKAAVVVANEDVQYQEIEEPKVTKGAVKIKVRYSGICGSDIPRVLNHGFHFYPIVLGLSLIHISFLSRTFPLLMSVTFLEITLILKSCTPAIRFLKVLLSASVHVHGFERFTELSCGTSCRTLIVCFATPSGFCCFA